ncbi:MAG: sugar phosphate isomerase/epimerase [Calditrichaeota bacterium]|nr:sugar phosphate isomerase/epimerase [Calditrichota bacterium]
MKSSDVKIGLSFFWQFLAGRDDPNHPAEWKRAVPDLDEGLERLKRAGVTNIEIKATPDPDPAAWGKIVGDLLERGFSVTFHASGRFSYPVYYQWVIEDVRRISEELLRHFSPHSLLWTIHPLHDVGKTRALIYRNNIHYLEEFIEKVRDLPVALALENLRNREDNERLHVGDTYEEILTILGEVNSNNLGICWDFGHACAMEELGQERPAPPTEFLQRVIHCHVHDCKQQITHLPPGTGRVPWKDYLQLLFDNGFRGTYNMEVVPYKLKDPADFLPSIEESAALLKSIIEKTKI